MSKENVEELFDQFTLKELMSKDGIQFEMGNEEPELDDAFNYNQVVNLSGDDLLAEINMYEFLEESAEAGCEGSISLGLHFRKVKSKLDDLSSDGRIKKKVMQEGTGDVVPEKALVIIKYSGYFEDQDEPYDSTHARGTTERYTLGGTELLYGLDVGIQSMKKGEIAIFWIDYTCAYGEMGCPPLIPPRGDVMFIVQLIDYLDSGTVNNFENLTVQEKKTYANVKLQVNSLFKIAADNFKRKKYNQAVRDYKQQDKEAQKLLSKSRQNLAICYNIQDIPRLACIECNAATHKTAKIYYHHGKALIKMGEYSEALTKLNKSLNMEPANQTVISEINKAITLQKKYMRIQKDLWSNCLDPKKADEEEKDKQRDKMAREFVETFVNDNAVQRQEIPAGIDASLLELIRKHAALSGMNIASVSRFDKETRYLQKPDYV
ncbi:hypothetical protein HCN44_000041 [Aphidius gifuensis]|uniref:peptidylprolyl isomerase n=1 Tax=Aphidius gifuensis TaxID=684658 RepID=A0A834XNZ4_APHGI|nr:hypothetical protein HCN44_000041 [Aphidius gifuensis]